MIDYVTLIAFVTAEYDPKFNSEDHHDADKRPLGISRKQFVAIETV